MSLSQRIGRKRSVILTLTTAALTALVVGGSGSVQAQAAADAESLYIVQVTGSPLATYTGGVAGFSATKPSPGARLNTRSSKATAYRGKLSTQYRDALRSARISDQKKVYDYGVTFNGFATRLTSAEAAKLRKTAGVRRIWKNEIIHADTVSTPKFLGLTGPTGAWAREFGSDAKAGEGIIIGVIDSGIWPEVPSFAPLPTPRPDQAAIDAKWRGTCDAGTDPNPANRVSCNNKLIGARWFDASNISKFQEFRSPRDRNGHGSHTAGTAGGNRNVDAVVFGTDMGKASGIAPAARIAAYKALWNQPSGTASGTTADLVAAIDAAVGDGVDVINYSISGSSSSIVGPDELAFLSAADAGVFVSTSAGNTPGTSTVAHNSPWTTTVAASSHDRAYGKTVRLGNGASYTGVGVAPAAVPSAPLIDSVNAGAAGATAAEAQFCVSGKLDPAKVTGKIVLCLRGSNNRVDKSLAVQLAGGVGMVLYDNPDNGLVADFHSVPTVHLNAANGLAVKAYIASAGSGATASLSAGFNPPTRNPAMAGFSSSGPALSSWDLLKPDVTGPGVDVIAAYSGATGTLFNQISGTSMSAPHVAGSAALLIQKNPGWSPAAVKSALMTTARPTDNTGGVIQRNGVDNTPLDYGAGHIRPNNAFDPGLVYDAGLEDWLRYGCGIGQIQLVTEPGACDALGSIDPSDLNYPSITVGDLPTRQTVTRRVTNVTNRAAVYTAVVSAPAGFSVSVSPSRLIIPAGSSASFRVTIQRTSATVGEWRFGSLTWTDFRGHEVRSPISVRQWTITAPGEVTYTGDSGSQEISGTTAYNGTITAAVNGLVASNVATRHLVGTNTNFNSAAPAAGPAVGTVDVTVPDGTKLARFATYDSDYPANTDLDLFFYQVGAGGALTLVGQSTGGTAEESFSFTTPGNYRVFVVQFGLGAGLTEQDVRHHAFVVGSASTGNLTVTPASQQATVAGTARFTATWSGLTPGSRYLGVIQYGDGTNQFPANIGGQTIIGVNA